MYYYITLFLLLTRQRNVKFFRKDYDFLEKTQSFYKIHTTALTWPEAMDMCHLENAELFYAYDKNEFEAVSEYRKTLGDKVNSDYVLIGISSNFIPGVFDTIDGIPVTSVHNLWNKDEPNNLNGNEDVLEMNIVSGTMNDISKSDKRLFICKRTLASLSWNDICNSVHCEKSGASDNSIAMSGTVESSINLSASYKCCQEGYTYNEANGRCYKFVITPKNWTQAYEQCRIEQSYLAIINTQLEVSFLTALIKNAPKEIISDAYTPGSVHLGLYKRSNRGWLTLKGTSLEMSGYTHFGYDSRSYNEKLHCGAMFYNGELRDISCSERCFFICEHEF